MAKFSISDPQTGKQFVIEGDSPPTEDELNDIFNTASVPKASPEGPQDFELSLRSRELPKSNVLGPKPIVSLSTPPGSPEQRVEEFKEGLFKPAAPIPRLPTTETARVTPVEQAIEGMTPGGSALQLLLGKGPTAEINRSVINQAISIPEFMESPAGIFSMAGGGIGKGAQAAISGAFTLDMLRQALGGSKTLIQNWSKMTPEQRARGVVEVLGAAGMGGLLGIHTAKGAAGIAREGIDKLGERQAFLGTPAAGQVMSPEVKAWWQSLGRGFASPAETEMVRTSPEIFTGGPNRLTLLTTEKGPDYATRIERSGQYQGTSPRPQLQAEPTEVRQGEGEQDSDSGSVQRVEAQKGEEPPVPEITPLKPSELQPALMVNGVPETGGQNHNAIKDALLAQAKSQEQRNKILESFVDDAAHVFVDRTGKVYNRDQAATALGQAEPLQSERLTDLKQKEYQALTSAKTGETLPSAVAPQTITGQDAGVAAVMPVAEGVIPSESASAASREILQKIYTDAANIQKDRIVSDADRRVIGNAIEEARKGNTEKAIKDLMAVTDRSSPKPIRRVARGVGNKLFERETQSGGPDILSWINENMKLLSRNGAKESWGDEKYDQNKSLWDDAPSKLPLHHQFAIYSKSGKGPDVVAQAAYEARVINEASPSALWNAINEATRKRIGATARDAREAKWLEKEAKQLSDWIKSTKKQTANKGIEVTTEDVAPGDMLEVDGQQIEVVSRDENGDVTLKDGKKFGVQKLAEGQRIYVEKFIEGKSGEVEFAPAEEKPKIIQAVAPVEATKPEPIPKQASSERFGGDAKEGATANGYVKYKGRWFKLEEDGTLAMVKSKDGTERPKRLPANSKVHSQLEDSAKAGPAPEETRSTEEILSKSTQVRVRLPEGATVLRVTDTKGRKSDIFIADLNRGANILQGVDIKKLESGFINRDKKFQAVKGDVKVSEVKRGTTAEAITTEAAPLAMSEQHVRNLAEGILGKGKVEITNDPSANRVGAAHFDENNRLLYIELNAARVKSPEHIRWVIEHELAHVAYRTGDLATVIKSLTPFEFRDILEDIGDSGYKVEAFGDEAGARSLQQLAAQWRNRAWFQKLVGTVLRYANQLGYKMTRLAAESAAAKSISDALRSVADTKPISTVTKGAVLEALIRTPEQMEKEKEFGRVGAVGQSPFQVEVRIAGAYGDPLRMVSTRADQLNVSERAKRLLGIPRMQEMFARAQAWLGTDLSIFGYNEARNWAKDKSPNEQWHVTQDALQSMGDTERKWDQIETGYQRMAARVDSPTFQNRLKTAALREAAAEAAIEKLDTFKNIRQVEIAKIAQQIIDRKVDDAETDVLRQNLSQARGLLNLSRAVGESMNEIVNKVWRNYWQMGGTGNSPQAFYDLYLAVRRGEGNPVTNAQELAYARLASEVLGVNKNLTERLMWMERAKVDPDFAQAVNAYGKAFAARLEADPIAAMRELIAKGQKLATKSDQAQAAWKAINRKVMRDLEEYSAHEEAKMVKDSIQQSPEWQQLVSLVNKDAEAMNVPAALREAIKRGRYDEFDGIMVETDPTGTVHTIDFGFNPQTASKAQEGVQNYLKVVTDWLNDSANENHPDRDMWQRKFDFIDSVYNTMGVVNPTAVKSLGWRFLRASWGMPEFLFRQIKLPAGKIVQTSLENWRRAQTMGADWMSKHGAPIIRLGRLAAKSHGYDTSAGPWMQNYREAMFNSVAWAFRHNLKIIPGTRLNGFEVTAEDLAYLRAVGKAENERFRAVQNLGVAKAMPQELLFDQWRDGVFALRRPKEFGTEPGTTISRNRSMRGKLLSTQMAKIAADDFDGIERVLQQDENWPWVVRWLNERSPDYSTKTPFEDLFRQIYTKINNGEPSASGRPLDTLDAIFEEIASNAPEEYNRQSIRQSLLGMMRNEIVRHFDVHYKTEPNPDIRVISATRESAFTRGFEHDTSNSFMYDYGLASKQEMASFAIDSSMYWLSRFQRGLDGLIKVYDNALEELHTVRNDAGKLADLKRRNRDLFKTGDDFRDFEDLQSQANELRHFRDTIGIWSGQDIATYESLKGLYRFVDDSKVAVLSGWKTLTRVFWGSTVKEGFTLANLERFYALAYPRALVSMAMSLSKTLFVGVPTVAARHIGILPKLQTEVSGIAEELFRTNKFFDRQHAYGLGFRTPTLDSISNILTMPVTKGGSYNIELSNNRALAVVQKAIFRMVSVAEAPLELVKTMFPTLGYAVQYDSVARQIYWWMRGMEARARRTFNTYEQTGQLGRFDLDNPKSVKNVLRPDEVIGDGILPATITQLSHANELFRRGTDLALNDAIMLFWKRLRDTPIEQRGNVRLLSADAAPGSDIAHLEQSRLGALATSGLLDIHHAAVVNRSWALRQSMFGRLGWSLAGWAVQSTRQWFALMGSAAGDPRLRASTMTAISVVMVGTALGLQVAFGDAEKRIFEKLKWLVDKEVDPVKHLGQGRDAKETTRIAISDMLTYITMLNGFVDDILSGKANRASLTDNLFVVQQIKSMLNYIGGVAKTHDPLYGLPGFVKRSNPITRPLMNRLPVQDGLVARNNARTIIQKWAPEDLVRETGGGFGLPNVTELTPYKEKLSAAIYNGDSIGTAEAYADFINKASQLGRPDPERLAQQTVRSLNPYSISLIGHPTDEQRATMLQTMPVDERDLLLNYENRYLAATQMLGVSSEMVKKPEKGTSGTGSHTAAVSSGTAGFGGMSGGGAPSARFSGFGGGSNRISLGGGRAGFGIPSGKPPAGPGAIGRQLAVRTPRSSQARSRTGLRSRSGRRLTLAVGRRPRVKRRLSLYA